MFKCFLSHTKKQDEVSIINKDIYNKIQSVEQKLDSLKKQISVIVPTMYGVAAYVSKRSYEDVRMNFLKSYRTANGLLRDVQKCNLYILKFLKQITDKNKLKFWLHAGTLIGALRHNGFIPWDDDVDIGMMREDFDKLVKIVKERKDCKIVGYYNDVYCSVSYQFRLNTLPVFIDIAVFDGVKLDNTDVKTRNKFLDKFRSHRFFLEKDFREKFGSPAVQDIGLDHCGPYDDFNKQRVNQLIRDYDKNLNPNKNTDYNCIYLGLENYPFPYPVIAKDDMFPLLTCSFEGNKFFIPKDSIYYLNGYGNIYDCPTDIGKTPHMYAFIKSLSQIQEFIQKNDNKKRKK